jgi:hypothetical protein
MAREGLIDRTGGGQARRPRGARTSSLPPRRSTEGAAQLRAKGLPPHRARPAGAVVFLGDERSCAQRRARTGHPGPHRDSPRTSTACTPRGSLTTRGGMTSHAAVCARHGPALRGRRRLHHGGLQRPRAWLVGRPDVAGRARPSRSTAPAARSFSGAVPMNRAQALRRLRRP